MQTLGGLHHVTAITADAQANLDFYTAILGLRLVKLTVNFDDPSSYHLYYGDVDGRPGTIITFFAWAGAPRGRIGPPQVSAIAFGVPQGTLDYWERRLREKRVAAVTTTRFGEPLLSFSDPEGLPLEIREVAATIHPFRTERRKHSITGLRGVTLHLDHSEESGQLLTEVLKFEQTAREGNRQRYALSGPDEFAAVVELVNSPLARRGLTAAGTVHHVAFRTPDDNQQLAWRETISGSGYQVTPAIDRMYFHSIYFREPGGVLFEIATEPPGFTIDEQFEELGTHLTLPPWLEPSRSELQKRLPPLRLPGSMRKAQNE